MGRKRTVIDYPKIRILLAEKYGSYTKGLGKIGIAGKVFIAWEKQEVSPNLSSIDTLLNGIGKSLPEVLVDPEKHFQERRN